MPKPPPTSGVTTRMRFSGMWKTCSASRLRTKCEPWVELQALDSSRNVLARYGGPDSTGLIPPDAARLGMDIAQADGTVLYRHELTSATRIPFARVVPAQGSVVVEIPLPTQLPGAFVEIDAVLYYRNVRTQYYRAASGDTMGHAPDVEVARTILYGL